MKTFLVSLHALSLAAALLFTHLFHAAREITLRTSKPFLSARKFFQFIGLLGGLRATTAAILWRLIAVL